MENKNKKRETKNISCVLNSDKILDISEKGFDKIDKKNF